MKTRNSLHPLSKNAIARVQVVALMAFFVVVVVGGYYFLSIIVPSRNQATPSSPSVTPPLSPTPLVDIAMIVSAGPGGTIEPGFLLVQPGASITYRITPNAGYQIANVIVDGISQGAITEYRFTNIQTNHEILASFTPVPTPTLGAS